MAGSNLKEPNLKKNDFSRLKKTEKILANKFMRESLVAISKLNTKYAVLLIYACYCLSAVEAIDNNQTNPNSQSASKDKLSTLEITAIVGTVLAIVTAMTAVLTFYCTHIKKKDVEEGVWSQSQVTNMIDQFSSRNSDKDEIQNLTNRINQLEENLQQGMEENLQNEADETTRLRENDQQKQQKLEEKENEVCELKKELVLLRKQMMKEIKNQRVIEEIKKEVGPIWGDYEADEKVKKYMDRHNMFEEGWHWSGSWCSDWGVTSYAVFWRLKNAPPRRNLHH